MTGKTQHGGARRGAGRPKGSKNRVTADIKTLAQSYGPDAIDRLAEIMNNETAPEAARVSAIKELLERGFGKVAQAIGGAPDLPPISLSQMPDLSNVTDEQLERLSAIVAQASGAGSDVD